MKQLLFALASLILLTSFISNDKSIDPTGTYELNSKLNKQDGEVFGYFGTIQVKKFDYNKVIMSFMICKGAPSYNLGSFIDTLYYNDNKIVYMPDADCKIVFNFKSRGIDVKHSAEDYNFSCGFGNGVIAHGFFKKASSKVPVIKDLLINDNL